MAKKFLMVIGGVAVVIVAIIIAVVAIFIPHSLKLDGEAIAYIQEAVPKIVAPWNAQALVDRATPQLMDAIKSREKMDQLFVAFSQLGAFKHLDTPKGGIFSSTSTGQGTVTLGNYRAAANFEKGAADIQIQLRRVDDGWKINGFHINSDAFLTGAPSPTPTPVSSPTP